MENFVSRFKKVFIVNLLIFTLIITSSYAENITVKADKVNIYKNTSSPQVIAQVLENDQVEVISKEQNWYKIKLDDKVNGWARKADIDSLGQYNYSKSGNVLRSYSDDTIKVSVENIDKYYVAKVWVQNPELQVKKVEADWGNSLATTSTLLNSTSGAIVGCNGSGFYKAGAWEPSQTAIKQTNWANTTEGYLVLTNGITRRSISGQVCNALLGILPSGSFKYYENNPYSDVINDGVKNTFTFGPLLVKDGQKYRQAIKPRRPYTGASAQLTTIGQIDANNFVIVSTVSPTTLDEIAGFGVSLGCNLMYNLDGGGSSSLWFRNSTTGSGTQVKASTREVGDALCFISLKNNN